MNKLHFVMAVAILVFSCTSEKPSTLSSKGPSDEGSQVTSTAQQFSGLPVELEIRPAEATRTTLLFLNVKNGDLSGGRIEWLVNNQPFPTPDPAKFNASDAAKGDIIQAKATIQGREVMSNLVQIKNSPPEIGTMEILPEFFKPGDTLSVEVTGSDSDGDAITYQYVWTKNGLPAGTDKGVEGTLKRGDKLSVTITPFDGESYGSPAVVQREIQNLPPVITEHSVFTFDDKLYTYQVKANDPDGDALTYSLGSPPAGMTIDSSTGLLKWVVLPGFKGLQTVTVLVSDGNGGTTQYGLKITIK